MVQVKDLVKLFSQAEKKGLLNECLAYLFTPTELADLQKRLELTAALLGKAETQREIAKNHQVSIAKITRGSNELKRRSPEFRAFLTRSLDHHDKTN